MRWLDGIINAMDMCLSKLQKIVKDREAACSPWGHKESDMTERLNNCKVKEIEAQHSLQGFFKLTQLPSYRTRPITHVLRL